MKKVLMLGLVFLLVFSIFGCGGIDADTPPAPQAEPEEIEKSITSAGVSEIDVDGITEELAAMIDHFSNQGINVTFVQPLLSAMETTGTGWIAGAMVSTDVTFFELLQYDMDNLDEQTQKSIENIDGEYNLLNGNIVMAAPDRFDEYEEDSYTEAVEAIIEAFENY